MDRTERLFALMDGLRRHRRPLTAADLASELTVCELRQDFRFFRADRIVGLSPSGERYPKRRTALVKAFQRQMESRTAPSEGS